MNCNREVVILRNVKSDYIEEAIIILKDSSRVDRGKALKEAEKIILDYGKRYDGIHSVTCRKQKKTKRWIPLLSGAVILAGLALLFFILT